MTRFLSLCGFLLLCAISELCGLGIIKLLRLRLEQRYLLFLSPLVTMSFWALTLSIAAILFIPLKQVCIPLWLATLGLGLFGVWRERVSALFHERVLLVSVFVITFAVTTGYIWFGYETFPGSPAQDLWTKIAVGQYLWEYARCTEGGLAPLYQFAAGVCKAVRFVASGLLGFISPFSGQPGDTQTSAGYLISLAFFVYACAVALFALTVNLGRRLRIPYLVLVVFSGWSLVILKANNIDNALALGFMPGLVSIVLLIRKPTWSAGILLALLGSASVYVYPDMSPFILAAAGFYASHCLWKDRHEGLLRPWLTLLIIALGLFCVLLSPSLSLLYQNLAADRVETVAPVNGVRPGGDYAGFLLPNNFGIAFWGLGDLSPTRPPTLFVLLLVAGVLFVLLGYGLLCLFRQRAWGSLAVFVFLDTAMLLYMIVFERYGYAAFKIAILFWWLAVYIMLTGYGSLKDHIASLSPRYAWVVAFTSFACILLLIGYTATRFRRFNMEIIAEKPFSFDGSLTTEENMASFKEVQTVKEMIGSGPLVVSVVDVTSSEWAMYYLRDVPIYLFPYPGYVINMIGLMDRAQPISLSDVHYILTDRQATLPRGQFTRIWSGDRFALWRIDAAKWVFIVEIENPNGLEKWDGGLGFWLGDGNTIFSLLASQAGKVSLYGEFSPGPSLPRSPDRRLAVSTASGYKSVEVISGAGPRLIRVPLEAGPNYITLDPLDQPALALLPNGDPRPLLIGLTKISVGFAPTP